MLTSVMHSAALDRGKNIYNSFIMRRKQSLAVKSSDCTNSFRENEGEDISLPENTTRDIVNKLYEEDDEDEYPTTKRYKQLLREITDDKDGGSDKSDLDCDSSAENDPLQIDEMCAESLSSIPAEEKKTNSERPASASDRDIHENSVGKASKDEDDGKNNTIRSCDIEDKEKSAAEHLKLQLKQESIEDMTDVQDELIKSSKEPKDEVKQEETENYKPKSERSECIEAPIETSLKRKRGRPPKHNGLKFKKDDLRRANELNVLIIRRKRCDRSDIKKVGEDVAQDKLIGEERQDMEIGEEVRKKRRPGRPRKYKIVSKVDTESKDESNTSPLLQTESFKRKRKGRPPKKKRGRPRKNFHEIDNTMVPQTSASSENKKRGRPRKVSLIEPIDASQVNTTNGKINNDSEEVEFNKKSNIEGIAVPAKRLVVENTVKKQPRILNNFISSTPKLDRRHTDSEEEVNVEETTNLVELTPIKYESEEELAESSDSDDVPYVSISELQRKSEFNPGGPCGIMWKCRKTYEAGKSKVTLEEKK